MHEAAPPEASTHPQLSFDDATRGEAMMLKQLGKLVNRSEPDVVDRAADIRSIFAEMRMLRHGAASVSAENIRELIDADRKY